ncbi:Spy/CpxP family protein refolding chaperone [Acaryochloris marina]|uniref:Spy/CpxP family protein refolding chaperone n=1 Tax=Acaryochloris marina TaxID=155978 RepID=UPI001BB06CD9|nr:Spy/CpxP family protein refolding chaperone [Acaryochloris marina]QUY40760.1 Spy/CpxP family protein refolding chaperone [Acaryochloris marina S15]
MKFRAVYLLAALPLLLPIGNGLTVATESLFPSYAIAQETTEKPNKEEFRKRRREQFRQQLNLSPDQVSEIDQIREQNKQDKQAKREALRAAKDKMQALMASDASDDELRAQHRILQDLRRDMGEARFETKLKIRQVLTPEQRTKMAELKKQRRGRWGRRHGRRHHGPENSQAK